jgi:hypothetical protein
MQSYLGMQEWVLRSIVDIQITDRQNVDIQTVEIKM